MKNKHLIIEQLGLTDEQFSRAQKKYALIEPIVSDYTTPKEKQVLRMDAQLTLDIKERALRQLIADYHQYGFAALVRKRRSDHGKAKAMDEAVITQALSLLKENPYRSVPMIQKLLQLDPDYSQQVEQLKHGTLYHHLRKAGYNFKHKQGAGSQRRYRKFEAAYANAMWQGDARHGIEVEHPTNPGKTKRCYLFAWVDDYSRKIVYAQYYFDEKVFSLEDSFRQAVLRLGIPEKIYVDNGSAYISKQFAVATDTIGTRKVHHLPYQAHCKGKVERDMQKIKRFQEEAVCAGVKTIEELNKLLHAWIEVEHNQKTHISTGEPPNERFAKSILKHIPRRIDNLETFNACFLWRDDRVISKYGTISLNKNSYRVKDIGVGEQVMIMYDPRDMERVHIYYKGLLHATVKAYKIEREQMDSVPEEKKNTPQKISASARRYMEHVLAKHEAERVRESNYAFSNIVSED